MSTKRPLMLWFKLQLGRKHITFPIALYVFHELLDSVQDLLMFLCLFAPLGAVKELVKLAGNLLGVLAGDEPYDLVDVTADNVRISIKIR